MKKPSGLQKFTKSDSVRKVTPNDSIHDFTHPIDGIKDIAEHDLLVGGFPCQDYSVENGVR